jgi:hypothetical protein
MGAAPVFGKPATVGSFVAVAIAVGSAVGVHVGCAVGRSVGLGVGCRVAAGVTVTEGVMVTLGVTVTVGVIDCEQIGPLMVLVIIVTAPTCASARPFNMAPAFMEIEFSTRMFPMNTVDVSSVAELPTLHHTLQGSPPVTDEPGDVMSVVVALKIQTPVVPVSVRFPDKANESAQ